MIGSFWNLCRACPSMPVDKLHSEYRSTYRWHEYTGPRQEVVRRPPHPQGAAPPGEKASDLFNCSSRLPEEGLEGQNELPKLEPALPRRKKHPDLAYRHHEFLPSDGGAADARARSEERSGSHWRHSRRSKSEGPARSSALVNGDERRRDSDPDLEKTGRDTGLLRKAISKISTEYRLQFAWPPGHASRRDASNADSTPKKSQSMGVINPAANAIVHRKRTTDFANEKDASEVEPLMNDEMKFNTEYKKKFRPFSQYEYSEGRFTSRIDALNEEIEEAHTSLINGGPPIPNESWYKEVVELRKKAGEYKNRGWGSDLAPEKLSDIYNKQIELWDQVSRRSSLSALSLATTTHRSYNTKEEKDEENNKKSSPTKAMRNAENSVRIMKDMIRHHLERTTGGSELDGLILSPTREKLEPTIPRKDDAGSQKNSPKKSSPQKTWQKRSQKSNNKTAGGLRTNRSQSVGSDVCSGGEKRSPKRQSRSATVKEKKTSSSTDAEKAKRPRPSSLNTSTASSRFQIKSSSVPPKTTSEDNDRSTKKPKQTQRKIVTGASEAPKAVAAAEKEKEEAPVVAEPEMEQPVVKSPPEPTRVKSPEQILMRSPDPVNWTVPLDTGKTFTVTQNVREGDINTTSTRPHSEVKAWTPPEIPPPVAQSAPPELVQAEEQQEEMQGMSVS